VIFSIKVLDDGVGDFEEVGHVNGVANIGVKVILEVLEHVHIFLNVLVSSNSWEGESFIVKFPGVDLEFWCNTTLGLDGSGNVQYVGPVSWIKSLGEEVDLVIEFSLSFIKINAWGGFFNHGVGGGSLGGCDQG
jgi:hypothetical protein